MHFGLERGKIARCYDGHTLESLQNEQVLIAGDDALATTSVSGRKHVIIIWIAADRKGERGGGHDLHLRSEQFYPGSRGFVREAELGDELLPILFEERG
jgi:hypothetical protein